MRSSSVAATGAGKTLASEVVARSSPDGHTLYLQVITTHAINASLYRRLPYDSVKDFMLIQMLATTPPILVVHPSLPVKSIKELIAYAKANPGKLYFGSSGTGGLQHFAGELFNHRAGIKLVHLPYKGTAAVIPTMLAGDVQVGFGTLFGVRPHLPSGRLKALAVTAGKRTPAAPELPTVVEAGVPEYELDQWYGVLTSAKVPAAIVRKLNAAINEATKSPDVAKRFAADGATPEQFGAHVKSEIAKWRKLVKKAKLELQQ